MCCLEKLNKSGQETIKQLDNIKTQGYKTTNINKLFGCTGKPKVKAMKRSVFSVGFKIPRFTSGSLLIPPVTTVTVIFFFHF